MSSDIIYSLVERINYIQKKQKRKLGKQIKVDMFLVKLEKKLVKQIVEKTVLGMGENIQKRKEIKSAKVYLERKMGCMAK